MDDMTTFERQLADGFKGLMGPSEPVDDLAVFEATASRSHRWGFTMFSALKFIAASVIVALFGGFLIAGVLTTPQGDEMAPAAVTASPSPMTTDELLSGMVTEEVEPGVLRVANDGYRDIPAPGMPWRERQEFWYRDHALVTGLDGSVWLLWPEGFYRLGGEESYPSLWGDEGKGGAIQDAEVALDGTLWVVSDVGLFAFDGTEWSDQSNEGVSIWGVDSAPDGTVWSVYPRDVDDQVIARFDGAEWTYTEVQGEARRYETAVIGDGELYVQMYVGYDSYPTGPFVRVREGQPLIDIAGLEEVSDMPVPSEAGIGADGTQWVRVLEDWESSSQGPKRGLVRIVGDEVTAYPLAPLSQHRISVAPDGSAWLRARRFTSGPEGICDGVARFDGETTTRYLTEMCVHDIDFSPDGAVWLQARWPYEGGPRPEIDTYVITPEAVAATE